DKGPRLGAALAYYAVFSIPPLIIILGAAIGTFYKGDLSAALAPVVGNDTARTMVKTAQFYGYAHDTRAAILGVGLLLFGTTGVFAELQDALNMIWNVQPKENGGILPSIRARFFSFTMVLGIAFLLLVSLALTALLTAFGGLLNEWTPFGEHFLK